MLDGKKHRRNVRRTFRGYTKKFTGIDFYVQDLNGEPFPNDDLDLQLVWLNAVEKYGRHINSAIMGEYWLSYITPGWDEYGAYMANLKTVLYRRFPVC